MTNTQNQVYQIYKLYNELDNKPISEIGLSSELLDFIEQINKIKDL